MSGNTSIPPARPPRTERRAMSMQDDLALREILEALTRLRLSHDRLQERRQGGSSSRFEGAAARSPDAHGPFESTTRGSKRWLYSSLGMSSPSRTTIRRTILRGTRRRHSRSPFCSTRSILDPAGFPCSRSLSGCLAIGRLQPRVENDSKPRGAQRRASCGAPRPSGWHKC